MTDLTGRPAVAAEPTVRIRRVVDDDADFEAAARVFTATAPDEPRDAAFVRWARDLHPGAALFLAETPEGQAVGVADVGRIFVLPAEYDAYWMSLGVVPEARLRGVGGRLLASVSGVARAAGKVALETMVSTARPEALAFLEHRGFGIIETAKAVRLDLAGRREPTVELPAGIRIVTLAERPDLLPGAHAVAVVAFPDIPGSEPMAAGSFEEFRARDVESPGNRADAFFMAVDGDDRVVGYANLNVPESRPEVGMHDMTAVLPEARGQGVASALKRATIAWAIRQGLVALETTNDIDNAPMRTINEGLGYRPLPDRFLMRGPLAPTTEEPR
ncbi:MAG TPA: GNAT family N-acetyltransferase [Candidatus Limnocylindrales bacterium]|nr:GNAT family N-acetyltransferase [Candidatus Limnocylindrales bacterium]